MPNNQVKQENKFTPGEWTTNYSSFGVVIFNDQCQRVANIGTNNPNSVADAELIAAAPELLAACQSVINWFNSTGGHVLGLSEELEAAIAKAKGEV